MGGLPPLCAISADDRPRSSAARSYYLSRRLCTEPWRLMRRRCALSRSAVASNTHGWYVGNQGAYPAQLQALLRAKGIDAQVTNAGVPFETTAMMLRRIDKDVPDGTDIVILELGGNDRRFFGTKEQRAANIAEMERGLQARSISVIVYDEEMPLRYRGFDLMHFTHQGHAIIAAALVPRVMEILDRRRSGVLPRRNATRPALAR